MGAACGCHHREFGLRDVIVKVTRGPANWLVGCWALFRFFYACVSRYFYWASGKCKKDPYGPAAWGVACPSGSFFHFWSLHRGIGEKTIIFVAYPLVRSRLAQRGLSGARSTARRRVDTQDMRLAPPASVSTRLQRGGSTHARGVPGGQNRATVGPTGTPRGASTRARGGSRDQVRAKLASSSVIWVPCGRHLGVI